MNRVGVIPGRSSLLLAAMCLLPTALAVQLDGPEPDAGEPFRAEPALNVTPAPAVVTGTELADQQVTDPPAPGAPPVSRQQRRHREQMAAKARARR